MFTNFDFQLVRIVMILVGQVEASLDKSMYEGWRLPLHYFDSLAAELCKSSQVEASLG